MDTKLAMESVVRPFAHPWLWFLVEAILSPGNSSSVLYMLHPLASSWYARDLVACYHPLHVSMGYLLVKISR